MVTSARPELRVVQSPFDLRAGGGRDAVLDGLRAIAVAAVVLGHAFNFRFAGQVDALSPTLHAMSGSAAVTGVQIFFLISGYVITRLLLQELRGYERIDLKGFYIRRIMRIWPPFALYLTAVAGLSAAGYIQTDLYHVGAAGLFTCNTGLTTCSWFVGHSWSLAVEEQFYLIWPVFLLLTPRRWVLPLLGAVSAALLLIAFHRVGLPFANEVSFLFIVTGVVVACSFRVQALIVTLVGLPVWLVAAAAFLVATLYASDEAMIIIKPLLLAVLVFGAGSARPIAALLRTRPFQIVGSCSYSLYLWQELFLGRPEQYSGFPPPVWLLPMAVWLSWMFVEKPGITLGRLWSAHRAAAPTPEPRYT